MNKYFVPKHTLTEWNEKYPSGTLKRDVALSKDHVIVKIIGNTFSSKEVKKQ